MKKEVDKRKKEVDKRNLSGRIDLGILQISSGMMMTGNARSIMDRPVSRNLQAGRNSSRKGDIIGLKGATRAVCLHIGEGSKCAHAAEELEPHNWHTIKKFKQSKNSADLNFN